MKKNKLLEQERNRQNGLTPDALRQAGLQDGEQDKNSFQFLIGSKGHYLHKRNGIFEACVQVEESKEHPEVEEFFKFTARRIPYSLFQQALVFLKAVYEKFKSEGAVLLTYKNGPPAEHSRAGLWGIVIPKQEVSIASVKYENDGHTRVVGSIHSHPGFSSQPSGTDQHDELNFDGIHIVVNGFDGLAEITVHAVVNGVRFRLKPEYAIEGLENKATFPQEWLGKVNQKAEPLTIWDNKPEKAKKEPEDAEDDEAEDEEEKCICCEEHHKQCMSCEFDEESDFEWPAY